MYTELLRMLRNVHVNFWQLLVSLKKWKLPYLFDYKPSGNVSCGF